jgi:hypothetical protein
MGMKWIHIARPPRLTLNLPANAHYPVRELTPPVGLLLIAAFGYSWCLSSGNPVGGRLADLGASGRRMNG